MAYDFEITEEQKLIKQTILAMVKKFEPRREEFKEMVFKQKKFPPELWNAISEIGVLGMLLPEKYGGTGLGLLAQAMAVEELLTHGISNETIILNTIAASCILKNGSEDLKKEFLPGIASGKLKFCFGATEPDAGSNTFRISTFAKKEGDIYKISGQKVFITGADIADYMLLVARTTKVEDLKEKGLPKVFGLALFVVNPKAKGVTLQELPTRGIAGASQFSIFMDDVEVETKNLVGEENMGSFALFNSLNPERITAAAMGVGITEQLLRKSVKYAKERKVFKDVLIGSHQAIQHPLAEIKIEQEAARLLTYRAAWAFDKGESPGVVGTYANMAKYAAAEVAIKAADRAIETFGGYGFSEEYDVIYAWEGARLLRTAPITKEMILNYISEQVLELPRSY
jgi:alkylation response protein AidB-like acyl-CoA dehydrogenase